jgi:hypothetical protein
MPVTTSVQDNHGYLVGFSIKSEAPNTQEICGRVDFLLRVFSLFLPIHSQVSKSFSGSHTYEIKVVGGSKFFYIEVMHDSFAIAWIIKVIVSTYFERELDWVSISAM